MGHSQQRATVNKGPQPTERERERATANRGPQPTEGHSQQWPQATEPWPRAIANKGPQLTKPQSSEDHRLLVSHKPQVVGTVISLGKVTYKSSRHKLRQIHKLLDHHKPLDDPPPQENGWSKSSRKGHKLSKDNESIQDHTVRVICHKTIDLSPPTELVPRH